MSYAVMPMADYKSACDKVRQRVGGKVVFFELDDLGYLTSNVFEVEAGKTYTLNMEFTDSDLYAGGCIAHSGWTAEGPYLFDISINSSTFTPNIDNALCVHLEPRKGLTANDIVSAYIECDGEIIADFVENIKIKSGELADKVDEVYEAGRNDFGFKGSAKGNPATLSNVHPIEHTVDVALKPLPAFAGLLEGCTFEDTNFGYIRSTPFTVANTGSYTLALNLADESKWSDWAVAWESWMANDSPACNGIKNPSYGEAMYLNKGYKYRLFIGASKGLKAYDILSATIETGDNVTAPNPSDIDDFSGIKVTATGKNLVDMKNPTEFATGGRFEIIDDNTVRNYGCAGYGNATLRYRIYAPQGTNLTITFDYELGGEATGTWNIISFGSSATDQSLVSGRVTTVGKSGYIDISFSRSGGSGNNLLGWIDIKNLQVEVGSSSTEYEPYQETEYTANADGTVENVKSISPTMSITTEEGVIVSAECFKDAEKEIESLTTAVALTGGN
jgi:hypothetical protein